MNQDLFFFNSLRPKDPDEMGGFASAIYKTATNLYNAWCRADSINRELLSRFIDKNNPNGAATLMNHLAYDYNEPGMIHHVSRLFVGETVDQVAKDIGLKLNGGE